MAAKSVIQFVLGQFAKRSARNTGIPKILNANDSIVQSNALSIENILKNHGYNPSNMSSDDILNAMNYHKAMMDQRMTQEFKRLELSKGVDDLAKKPPFQGFTPTIVKDKTLFKDSPEAIAKIKADNKAAAERLRNKKKTVEDFRDDGDFDPGGMASGGLARAKFGLGDLVKEHIPAEYRLYAKSILPGGESGKVGSDYFTEDFKQELRKQALDKYKITGKLKGNVHEGSQHRSDSTYNKLIGFPSTYASLGTYGYEINPKTLDVKIKDTYDWNPHYGKSESGAVGWDVGPGDKQSDVDLSMLKDYVVNAVKTGSVDKANALELIGNYFGGKESEGKGFDVDIDIPTKEATSATEGSFATGGLARVGMFGGGRLVKGASWVINKLKEQLSQFKKEDFMGKLSNLSSTQKEGFKNELETLIKQLERGGNIPDQMLDTMIADPKFKSVVKTRSIDKDLYDLEDVLLDRQAGKQSDELFGADGKLNKKAVLQEVKDSEEKMLLDRFNVKDRKPNASGGLANILGV